MDVFRNLGNSRERFIACSRLYGSGGDGHRCGIRFKDDISSTALRIMMLSRSMHELKQNDTSRFAVAANRPAAQPVCLESPDQISGISGRQGLRSEPFSNEDGPYPLRT
jgi:hypothetical protein